MKWQNSVVLIEKLSNLILTGYLRKAVSLNSARLRPELLILVLMVMISMFVIPLPTYLVGFLIAPNIVLAILVFYGPSLYDKPPQFFNVSAVPPRTPFVRHYRSVPAVLS